MKQEKISSEWIRCFKYMLLMTIICGVIYTVCVTVIAQIFFSKKSNGSMITVNGKTYGSELLGETYSDESHMWGRIMPINTSTFTDKNGKPILYSQASQLSPSSEKLKELVKLRVQMIKKANPDAAESKIPQDLLTVSASGLDPHISKQAADYQISRIAKANGLTNAKVKKIIQKCTTHKAFGIFGTEYVNVQKVNLMLDKILT